MTQAGGSLASPAAIFYSGERARIAGRSRGSAHALAREIGDACDVVLLGSIASPKYVDILLGIFGERLRFPSRLRRPRRHEPRRPAAARRPARAPSSTYVAGGWRRPPRRSAAQAGAASGIRHPVIPAMSLTIPRTRQCVCSRSTGREVRLTNLRKVFWSELRDRRRAICFRTTPTSRTCCCRIFDDRAMVMKRYPHGAAGEFFFMKRAPEPASRRGSPPAPSSTDRGSVIDFPMIQDRASLLWVVNLGCIDLNQWYARATTSIGPTIVHFDLDPGRGRRSSACATAALVVREALDMLAMPTLVKTTGSKGLHVYVPIVREPAAEGRVDVRRRPSRRSSPARHPALITAEYRVAKRPRGRVLVDYNQNAWGRTLGVHLFGAAASRGDGLDAGHLEGNRAGRADRGFHDPECAEARASGSGTCGNRSDRHAAGSICGQFV